MKRVDERHGADVRCAVDCLVKLPSDFEFIGFLSQKKGTKSKEFTSRQIL